MPARVKPSLTAKIGHFDVKDQVARDLLVTARGCLLLRQYPESNPNIFHFLCDRLGPEGIPIYTVELVRVLNGLWDFKPIFVGPFEVTRLMFTDKKYDPLSLTKDVVHPPIEVRFVVSAGGLCIFGGLNRVGGNKLGEACGGSHRGSVPLIHP